MIFCIFLEFESCFNIWFPCSFHTVELASILLICEFHFFPAQLANKSAHFGCLRFDSRRGHSFSEFINNFFAFFYLHKQSLCERMNSIFSNPSRNYCFDPNIVATKCVYFESVHFDQ